VEFLKWKNVQIVVWNLIIYKALWQIYVKVAIKYFIAMSHVQMTIWKKIYDMPL
jgi:hypothetical protein